MAQFVEPNFDIEDHVRDVRGWKLKIDMGEGDPVLAFSNRGLSEEKKPQMIIIGWNEISESIQSTGGPVIDEENQKCVAACY